MLGRQWWMVVVGTRQLLRHIYNYREAAANRQLAASEEDVKWTDTHKPNANHKAVETFAAVEHTIKHEIKVSRRDWDKHEPKMWSRVQGITDEELVAFNVAGGDLVLIRNGATSYGTILLGKIKIPAVEDAYVHVRILKGEVDGKDDIKFHSIFTNEGNKDVDGHPTTWQAVQTLATPLDFFNE
ncbi:hypothetical protein FIBSPDRAFT_1035708 [Athelia psychrophila]|uniref:Uncharacterized protein n=1 Tax=Athelia psychrophila TaxID=1759441 RepID=A0A166XFI4_9AGAM|nr:hypothetical protein FIBSPDRAFT_1035708 [Fibularhizoctonia sp. CBS 109695]